MKKIITLFSITLFSLMLFSQTPITITSSDVPLPANPFNLKDIVATSPGLPSQGSNQTWNYSTNGPGVTMQVTYPLETDPFFTSLGIDVSFDNNKTLVSSLGYLIAQKFDFTSTGVLETGLYVYAQAYGLSAFTGNNNDSITFIEQKYDLTSSPRALLEFPYTANSSWHSIGQRVTDFELTVASAGLNNAPGQHKYFHMRNDTIVGWGKMSVYTPAGPSIQYDVLMDKVSQWAVDSFYINGSPASPLILSAFGASQGQITNLQYFYNFNRAGSYNYLLRFFYGTDNTYTTPTAVFQNTDNLQPVGVNDINSISYSTLVFPNPSNGNEINVKLIGKTFSENNYVIIDVLGRTVQTGTIPAQCADFFMLTLDTSMENGNYFLKITDKTNKDIVSEKILIQR